MKKMEYDYTKLLYKHKNKYNMKDIKIDFSLTRKEIGDKLRNQELERVIGEYVKFIRGHGNSI